jgi:TPR repeat protein
MSIKENIDHNESIIRYREKAEQGDADAQCNIGLCYYDG